MVLFAIVNNSIEKKFIECVAAEDYDDIVGYCDKKYGKESLPIGLPVVLDTKGNPVSAQVFDLVKEEFKKK
ncbi:hypothetical protein IAI10_16070 [Clostridium sp. 19966]|uniref:hypothetical protein n=1 Tax=Clostridium sp. 19966 TaxID=2768166 RepID=UPI0028DEE3A5|nr:hypothetical protein [Clostridium sp. 19966]MDT8718183.1 hypothetical protein [Clostridium sp. 19966]